MFGLEKASGKQVEGLWKKSTLARERLCYLDCWGINLQKSAKLLDGGIFINRHKDFVEKGFEVIANDSVHDEALEWRNLPGKI